MTTQKDIAERLGVSQSSVACAFHPTLYTQISAARRELILETAQDMGYVPNRAGRRLALARTDSQAVHFDQVGLIYLGDPARHQDSVFADSVFLSMMQGAERELSTDRAALTFVRVETPDDWTKIAHLATGGGVDGWLVYGPVDDTSSKTLAASHLPWVILGDHRCTTLVHEVNVDHGVVPKVAVQHLLELGHRRIAYFAGSMRLSYQDRCLAGFEAAIREAGLELHDEWVGTLATWGGPTFAEMTDRLLALDGPLPTAIVTGESGWADKVTEYLASIGQAVPETFSVIGSESMLLGRPAATVSRVDVPMSEVGAEGARLLRRIVQEQLQGPQRAVVAPSLSPGWSTAPPRD